MRGWQTGLIVTGSVVGAALVAWPLLVWWEVRACEKPKYTVIRPLGHKKSVWTGKPVAELRRYAPYLIAEVVVTDSVMRGAVSQGFRQIAGFIFGKNTAKDTGKSTSVAMTSPVRVEMVGKSEKIAMTSPVRSEVNADGTYKVSFVMPSKYTIDTLPAPANANITIREVPSRTVAAMKFYGGMPSNDALTKRSDELKATIDAEALQVDGELMLYEYYPPFAPNWMRLQEVLYPVKDT